MRGAGGGTNEQCAEAGKVTRRRSKNLQATHHMQHKKQEHMSNVFTHTGGAGHFKVYLSIVHKRMDFEKTVVYNNFRPRGLQRMYSND